MNVARNRKMTRLKQAKEEAEKEISEYRAQIESEIQKNVREFLQINQQSSGDSGSIVNRLEVVTEAKIGQLKSDSAKISQYVAQMLLKHVKTVKI